MFNRLLLLVFIVCLILVDWFVFLFVFKDIVVYLKKSFCFYDIMVIFMVSVVYVFVFCKWVGNCLLIFKCLFFFDI